MSSGRGTGKTTLGGVQRATFTPNVNARRNKKQTVDDPFSRLLHADTPPDLPPVQQPPVPKPVAQTKRQSPRLSPRASPRAAAAKRSPSGGGAAAGPSGSKARSGEAETVGKAEPGSHVIRPPSSLGEREAEMKAEIDAEDGMELEPALLPPAATPVPDDTSWLWAAAASSPARACAGPGWHG